MKWVTTALAIACFALALAKVIGLGVLLLQARGAASSDGKELSVYWIVKQCVYAGSLVVVGVFLLGKSRHGSVDGKIFDSKRWNDIDWCDQNVEADSLSDEEILDAASKVHPYSTALIELLDEAGRRRLDAIVPIARQHLTHPDPLVSTWAIGVLQDLGDGSDVPMLLNLVEDAVDHCHLAAILAAIVTLDPSRSEYALKTAGRGRDDEDFDNDYVMASVIVSLAKVLPDDSPGLV